MRISYVPSEAARPCRIWYFEAGVKGCGDDDRDPMFELSYPLPYR